MKNKLAIERILALRNAVTRNHTGKMTGLWSVSTSNLLNPNCRRFKSVKGSICEKCFADIQLKRQARTRGKMEVNTDLMTETILSDEEIKIAQTLKRKNEKVEVPMPDGPIEVYQIMEIIK